MASTLYQIIVHKTFMIPIICVLVGVTRLIIMLCQLLLFNHFMNLVYLKIIYYNFKNIICAIYLFRVIVNLYPAFWLIQAKSEKPFFSANHELDSLVSTCYMHRCLWQFIYILYITTGQDNKIYYVSILSHVHTNVQHKSLSTSLYVLNTAS